jgi:hypothetical protein
MVHIYPSRFDFMAKYLYIKQYDKKYNTYFFIDLYKAHINTFNGGYELPDSTDRNRQITKKSIDDFLKVFDNLIYDMKMNGFKKEFAIPVNSNGIIENGSHRLLTSYYFNIKPEIKNITTNGDQEYNYNFFLKRNGKPPLQRIYADTMALEYINHNPNQRCMILYPIAYDNNKIKLLIDIIKQYGYIYYHKEIKLSSNGLLNLIKELYRGEDWIGGLFPNSDGGKFRRCWSDNPIIYISISMYDVTKIIEMKDKCREIYKLGKHSLHVSDYISDTRRISCSLLNENSIQFLNKGTNNIIPQTKTLLINYFNEVGEKNEDYIIIDIKNKIIYETITNIEIHNILYNPENFYYFNGYKVFKNITM